MCWFCDLREAESCGAIAAASRAWGETVYRYAADHGMTMDEAAAHLTERVRCHPMPEWVQ